MLTHKYKPHALSSAMPMPEGVLEPHDYFSDWGRFNINFPAVNKADSEEAYHLEIAAPGLDREIFCIEVQNHLLMVSTKPEKSKTKGIKKYFEKQFEMTPFKRSFSLPENVRTDAIEANYRDGILYIDIPKKAEVKNGSIAKKVNIL